MGGREHSVVVDSESWTKTMEKISDSHLNRHITEGTQNSEKSVGGMWWAGMRQSDAELHSVSAQRELKSDSTHHAQIYTWSLFNVIIFK